MQRETKKAASFADPGLPAPLSFGVKPEEAIKYFRSKQVVTRKEFDLLAEDARSAAFTVSGIYKQDILEGFKSEIADSLEQGTSQKELTKRLRSILAGAGHRQLGAFHLETVIRTNLAMAYATGRRRSLEAVTEDFPFWQYHAVGDDRVRATHLVLDGMILPANHDFWRDHYPPWEFSCRCSCTATDSIPDDYNHQNPSGTGEVFYDEKGTPAKAEIGTRVYDLVAQGNFQGVPPQGGLREVIEAGAKRAERKRTRKRD